MRAINNHVFDNNYDNDDGLGIDLMNLYEQVKLGTRDIRTSLGLRKAQIVERITKGGFTATSAAPITDIRPTPIAGMGLVIPVVIVGAGALFLFTRMKPKKRRR